ncbi:MAG: hypothetical protein JWO40_286 [Candidatus Doudnabacteria bacterium]|nr:hypothetical protein [Candidatus Doudnabacteria bacterium]
MISPHNNMYSNKIKKINNRNDQKGVTLLLSILILSAITAIVFSVAAIALNEVRTSADLAKTEPIIKADEAMAEDGLFNTVRGYSTLPACSASQTQGTVFNGVTVSSCASYYFNSPYAFVMTPSARRDFYLYNPTNQGANPGYTSASITIVAGSTGTVYFCPFAVANCVVTPTSSQTLDVNGTTTWNSPVLDPTIEYQIIVINGVGSTSSYSFTTAPNGLPAGTTTIINQGAKQGVTRKLQVTVPQ